MSDYLATKLDHKVEHGYSWEKSPMSSYGLTKNAIYAASRVEFIKPKNGESPIKLQPKASHKETQQR